MEFECGTVEVSGPEIRLHYRARTEAGVTHEFTELITLPGSLDGVPFASIEPTLRLLSLAASLSYFKAFAPATFTVPSGLTAQERHFITELITHGLGEFAYVNHMPQVLDPVIEAPMRDADPAAGRAAADPSRILVAVGGGKDSIVSIEALKAAGFSIGLFSVNSYAPIENTAHVAGIALHTARRQLDPHLFELNAAGAPNGHVPVTAVNSLIAVLTAQSLGFDTVAFSNEASSSYGNVMWAGRTINHQWSKSIDFERLLSGSLPTGAPRYLSLLRPLTELRISRRFATLTAYHSVFTSCNRAFKLAAADRTSWCGDCPKCRFVFLCLGPFLSRAALLEIFGGRDLFADEAQLEGFLELLGATGFKPFECVGEPDECVVALSLLREHPDWADHPWLARREIADLRPTAGEQEAVFAFAENAHQLPPSLEAVAREV